MESARVADLYPSLPVEEPPLQGPWLRFEGLTEEVINTVDDPAELRRLFLYFYRKAKSMEKEFEELQAEHLKELEKARSEIDVFKDELYKKIYQAVEHDFNCAICTELFVEPTVLQCGHTYCHHCIREWTNKNRDCPVCRKSNNGPLIKHGGMNSFITKIHTMLSPEIRDRRDEAVRERGDLLRKKAAGASDSRHDADPPDEVPANSNSQDESEIRANSRFNSVPIVMGWYTNSESGDHAAPPNMTESEPTSTPPPPGAGGSENVRTGRRATTFEFTTETTETSYSYSVTRSRPPCPPRVPRVPRPPRH